MSLVWARDWTMDGKQLPHTVLLARHGRTEWNERHVWQGHADVPLDELGREQAGKLAAAIATRGVDAIVASDLSRAWETATIVGAAAGLEPVANSLLREIDIGEWEGLGLREIRDEYADLLDAVARGEDPPRGRTGETTDAFRERVVRGFEQAVRTCPEGTLLIVAHGGTNKNLVGHFLDVPARLCGRLTSGLNGSLTEIRLDAEGPQLVMMNDARHLDV